MKSFHSRYLLFTALLFLCSHSFGQNPFGRKALQEAETELEARNYRAALEKARLVYNTAVANEDTLLKGESSLVIGKAFHKSRSYLVALEYLFTALRIMENNTHRKAEILTIVGEVYYDWGGYKKALDYFQQADELITDPQKRRHLMEAIGDTYLQLNLYDNALVFYDHSLRLTDAKEYEARMKIFKKKGEIFIIQKDYSQALEMNFKQLDLTPYNSPKNKSIILNNIGYLYNHKSDYDAALLYFKKSREASLSGGETDSLYITLINIGAIYNIRKNLDSSLMVLNEALAIVQSDPDKQKEATVRNYLAATLMEFKLYSEALNDNQMAIQLSRKADNPSLLAECYYIRSKILEMRGKLKEQKYYYRQFKRLRDSLDLNTMLQQNRQAKVDSLMNLKEMQIQQLLLNKEIDYLNMKQYELLSRQREKDLKLLAQQNDIQKMALHNEILQKDQVQRRWLLTQQELENEKKAREIVFLQKAKSEQELEAEKTAAQLSRLSEENLIKELDLEKQKAELNRSQQIKLWIVIGFSAGIGIIFLLFSYYRLRKNSLENQLKLTNLEIQQRLLRSQMNPHFLFNSLNSIQGFISSNNTTKADRFLALYARLMRSILENSAKERVLLHDELSALKSYIELEQMRQDYIFSYEILVNDLDEDVVTIPPMLIQPYVENAVLHGLRHKQEGGHLQVSLTEKENYLICEISDNGIGREASRIINMNKSKEYRSVAMNLTKERLQLLNKQENTHMDVHIDDLVAPGGEPLGTLVTLKIILQEWI